MKISRFYVLVGIGALAALYFAKQGLGVAADFASTKLNPASDQNFIYQDLVGGIVRNVTGDDSQTLGGLIYDKTHPAATLNNPDTPYCTNLFGIGCKTSPGVPVDENDSTFWDN